MLNYLKLIRYKNLIILIVTQSVFRFGFLKLKNLPLALTNFNYFLLILATVLIACGGYIINDIMDQETDSINKPNRVFINKIISENNAYNWYAGVTIVGVAIGFYLSNVVAKPSLCVLFILTAALLYIYSTSLKQIALIGNLSISILVALSIIIIGVFDIYPITNQYNSGEMGIYFSILFDYAKFAFIITLIREIIKDCEDHVGDKSMIINTLPIIVGFKKSNYITQLILLFAIGYLFFYTNKYLMNSELYIATIYMLLLVIAPLIFCFIKLFTANKKSDYKLLNTILKLILFFGIFSVLIITITSTKSNV